MNYLSDEEFIADLHREDELGSVIRAHLHVENVLEELLSIQIPKFSTLNELELTYKSKIILSLSMGLNEEFKSALIFLGTIRNNFAHKPKYILTNQDTKNFYNTFAAPEKELIQSTIQTVAKELSDKVVFKNLEPKFQFIIMTVCLRQILTKAKMTWRTFV